VTWTSIPRYRTKPMTLMRLSPCGHAETVEGYIGYPWWGCEVCRTVMHIQAAVELPVTCWIVPGTGGYRPLLR